MAGLMTAYRCDVTFVLAAQMACQPAIFLFTFTLLTTLTIMYVFSCPIRLNRSTLSLFQHFSDQNLLQSKKMFFQPSYKVINK